MKTNTFRMLLGRSALLATVSGFLGVVAGCSSSDGPGNLLAGQACDSFTLASDPQCVCCSEQPGACVAGESPCAPKDASPSCGNPCPSGLTCIKLDGKAVCGTRSDCTGPAEQSCGSCGTQTRTCNDGVWSDWEKCQDEGECLAGVVETCTSGTRACSGSCSWGPCLECQPGRSETTTCGTCQEQTRTCREQGTWTDWSKCGYTGVCSPGDTQACSGGEQQCGADCHWSGCTQYECQPGDVQTSGCGNCGTQTVTCQDNHTWGATTACSGTGECAAGAFESCGVNSYHECSSKCSWGACNVVECTPGTTGTENCGNCGTRSRQCVNGTWTAFGACSEEGVCSPNASQACGSAGTQRCDNSCQWGSCTGQSCTGSSVELCGNCGFHSRVCNNGAWSVYGVCMGERDCLPGAKQSCSGAMTQTCGLDCYWSTCQ